MNYIHKIYLTIALLFLFSLKVYGQELNLQVMVQPPYSLNISDYLDKGNNVLILVTNNSVSSQEFKLIPSIEGNNGVYAAVIDEFQPLGPITLGPRETRSFTFNQLRSLNNNLGENDLIVRNISLNPLKDGGILPEGMYTLCIKALHFQSGQLLSAPPSCAVFNITAYDPPNILIPANGSEVMVPHPQMVNFQWTPSGISGKTRYTIRIVDLTMVNVFNPNDAFDNPNIPPYFEQSDLIATAFSYDMTKPKLFYNREYAVQVIAYDPKGETSYKNFGRSRTHVFTVSESGINLIDKQANVQTTSGQTGKFGPSGLETKKSILSKTFKGDDGGIFFVETLETPIDPNQTYVYIYGEHPGLSYGIVYEGKINRRKNDKINGHYAMVPRYHSKEHGTLDFQILDDGKKLLVTNHTGDLSFSQLEEINLLNYINWLPQVEKQIAYADTHYVSGRKIPYNLTGLYKGRDDAGWYYSRQVGNKVYMVGESEFKKGEKPQFCRVFVGEVNTSLTRRLNGKFCNLSKGNQSNDHPDIFGYRFFTLFNKENHPNEGNSVFNEYNPPEKYLFGKLNRTNISPAKGLDIPPKTTKKDSIDTRPKIKAEKSASLVLFYFGDGPFKTLFQNIGVNLQHAFNGYEKTCLLKEAYWSGNKDPDYVALPTKENFFHYLKLLAEEGYYIDIFIFTHGKRFGIDTQSEVITPNDIQNELGNIFKGGKFPIRMVYQMNCYGSNMNAAFRDVGAKAVNGANNVNFHPTRFNVFGKDWAKGKSFYDAIRNSEKNKSANKWANKGIQLHLGKRIATEYGDWDCKKCPPFTSLNHTNDCLACYFVSFWGLHWNEYFYDLSGLNNLLLFSKSQITGNNWMVTKNSKPTW